MMGKDIYFAKENKYYRYLSVPYESDWLRIHFSPEEGNPPVLCKEESNFDKCICFEEGNTDQMNTGLSIIRGIKTLINHFNETNKSVAPDSIKAGREYSWIGVSTQPDIREIIITTKVIWESGSHPQNKIYPGVYFEEQSSAIKLGESIKEYLHAYGISVKLRYPHIADNNN